ncbi:MAG TPA: hypothetical protein VIE46_12710 [Gemmatimonadales bacterium]|jgi:hypothetical protein
MRRVARPMLVPLLATALIAAQPAQAIDAAAAALAPLVGGQ